MFGFDRAFTRDGQVRKDASRNEWVILYDLGNVRCDSFGFYAMAIPKLESLPCPVQLVKFPWEPDEKEQWRRHEEAKKATEERDVIRNIMGKCRHDQAGRCVQAEDWDGREGKHNQCKYVEDKGWICRLCRQVAITPNQAVGKVEEIGKGSGYG